VTRRVITENVIAVSVLGEGGRRMEEGGDI